MPANDWGPRILLREHALGGLKPEIPKHILKRPLIDPPIRDLARRNIALAIFLLKTAYPLESWSWAIPCYCIFFSCVAS